MVLVLARRVIFVACTPVLDVALPNQDAFSCTLPPEDPHEGKLYGHPFNVTIIALLLLQLRILTL